MLSQIQKEQLYKEFQFKAKRSSGPGGQHVNKVSSKMELSFYIRDSAVLTEDQKMRIIEKLGSKISTDFKIVLTSDDSRSQHKNKEKVVKKFFELIDKALKVPKKRRPTKPSKSSIQKRLDSKKKRAQKKARRRKLED